MSDIKLDNIEFFDNQGQPVKIDSFMGLMEQLEKNCSCAGFSCCPFPHFYMKDAKTNEKTNVWFEDKQFVIGNDQEMNEAAQSDSE